MHFKRVCALLVLPLGLFFGRAAAQETPTEATLIAVDGQARVRLPDGTSKPATPGLKLRQGAAIVTGRDATVSLQAHEGIVAVVAGSTRVDLERLSVGADGTRHTLLDLKHGNVATSLDPARKSVNDFGVRTERGVARAHGTTLTVSVNGNVYTVSVLVGSVTVEWAGQHAVSIVGNTPASVTSNVAGQVSTVSLGTALGAGTTAGLADALTAAAAAVATVATTPAEVTQVVNTIATAAGTSPNAGATVAGATAAATGAAVSNPALVAAAGGSTSIAATITTAAVTSATSAGNPSAAALIVTSAVNAVADSIPGTNVNAVATALADASNSVAGNAPVSAGLVTAGVNAAQNPATAQGQPPGSVRGSTVATTPVRPIDPTLIVSPSS